MQEASHIEMPFSCYATRRVCLAMAFVYVGGEELMDLWTSLYGMIGIIE